MSEAEKDAAKAKPIEDELERNKDPKCNKHNENMDGQAAHVAWRYDELYLDRHKLFINHKEISNPLIVNGKNKGSWVGHQDQYKIQQGILRGLIKKASEAGCPATPNAIIWVNKPAPEEPGKHS